MCEITTQNKTRRQFIKIEVVIYDDAHQKSWVGHEHIAPIEVMMYDDCLIAYEVWKHLGATLSLGPNISVLDECGRGICEVWIFLIKLAVGKMSKSIKEEPFRLITVDHLDLCYRGMNPIRHILSLPLDSDPFDSPIFWTLVAVVKFWCWNMKKQNDSFNYFHRPILFNNVATVIAQETAFSTHPFV